jgi:hypothetical protein
MIAQQQAASAPGAKREILIFCTGVWKFFVESTKLVEEPSWEAKILRRYEFGLEAAVTEFKAVSFLGEPPGQVQAVSAKRR